MLLILLFIFEPELPKIINMNYNYTAVLLTGGFSRFCFGCEVLPEDAVVDVTAAVEP